VERLLRAGGAPVPPVIGGEGLRPKPAPDIFLAAARHLGLPPAATLVVEDTEKGIRAARAGGFPVLLVRNRYNRPLPLAADAEVSALATLLEWAPA
jgi:sugar-phosphatase